MITSARKTLVAGLGAAALAIALAAIPTEASARHFGGGFGGRHFGGFGGRHLGGFRHFGFHHRHWGHRRGWYGLGWGLATVGAAVAADCYLARKTFYDQFGNVYFRRVSVCD